MYFLKHENLQDPLTAAFKRCIDNYIHLNASWRTQAAAMLKWAIGFLDKWPELEDEQPPKIFQFLQDPVLSTRPVSLRSDKEIDAKRDIMETWHWRARTRQLIGDGVPFPQDEMFLKNGLTCYDDVIRSSARFAKENGEIHAMIEDDFVFNGKAFKNLPEDEYHYAFSVIRERHFAMNWLCGYAPNNEWDKTPTDT